MIAAYKPDMMTPERAKWLYHCLICARFYECGAGKVLRDQPEVACVNWTEGEGGL